MEISKITFNGHVLIDLSSDTVEKNTLLEGITAHAADGKQITGHVDLEQVTGFYVDENGYLYLAYRG